MHNTSVSFYGVRATGEDAPRMHKTHKFTRGLVMLLAAALVSTLTSSAASARKVEGPKDDKYLRTVADGTRKGIASVAGSQLEVNEFGVNFAEYLLQSDEVADSLITQAKTVCKELNVAAKRGAKAVRARARALGTEIGRDDRESLEELEADPDLSDQDKFSVGMVIGLMTGVAFKAGVQSYCPRHNKQAVVLTTAWSEALGS